MQGVRNNYDILHMLILCGSLGGGGGINGKLVTKKAK